LRPNRPFERHPLEKKGIIIIVIIIIVVWNDILMKTNIATPVLTLLSCIIKCQQMMRGKTKQRYKTREPTACSNVK